MPTHLGWQEIAVRLTLTIIAGALIGLDRGGHGRAAGLRTTMLVCLAASISMIQANLLLTTAGKRSDSILTLDLMRLPLGILTGMGFIGGGAILKKGDVVLGVTTAATLWFVTVIGLCFGGGQTILGAAAVAIGLIVLTGLKHLEALLPQERRAALTVAGGPSGMTEDQVRQELLRNGLEVVPAGISYDKVDGQWILRCEVRWKSRPTDEPVPTVVQELSRHPSVSRLEWKLLGHQSRGFD
jgi:putative Mg2+ transporter-C (MgtC) family protein